MSDDHKVYQATPSATLEQRIMDPRIAKSEAEWWAAREIDRLRAEINDMSDDVERLSLACAAEAVEADSLRAHIAGLESESFGLAANQCHHGYGTENGDHRCRYQDRIAELEAELAEVKKDLEWERNPGQNGY